MFERSIILVQSPTHEMLSFSPPDTAKLSTEGEWNSGPLVFARGVSQEPEGKFAALRGA